MTTATTPGHGRAQAVQPRPEPPALIAQLAPMLDHSRLRQREAGEHADRVQRDHPVHARPKDDQEDDGGKRKTHHAIREHQTVAPVLELPGEEPVLGHDGRQTREAVEAGVRSQDQDGHGGDLQRVVEEAAPVDRSAHLTQYRVGLLRQHAQTQRERRDAHEQRAQNGRHDHERGGRVLALGFLERGHTVRDRLGARHGRAPAGERSQHEEDRQRQQVLGARRLAPRAEFPWPSGWHRRPTVRRRAPRKRTSGGRRWPPIRACPAG